MNSSFSPLISDLTPVLLGWSSFQSGFFHPLHGMDHLMMAVGVGFWSVVGSKRPDFRLPVAFLFTLVLGFTMGALSGPSLSSSESALGVSATLALMGVCFAFGLRLSRGVKLLAVAVFGVTHGHTHGMEMSETHLPGLLGLIFSTAILHVSGISAWVALQKFLREPHTEWALRIAGLFIFGSAFLTEI